MEEYLIFIYLIVIFFLGIVVIRFVFYNYITNLNDIGIVKEDDKIYNDYYKESTQKKNRVLINNVAFLRSGIFSGIYNSDIKILEIDKLKDGDSLLIVNNNDCNFELNLIQIMTETKKQVKIVIIKNNLLESEKCKKIITKTGFKNVDVLYINDILNFNNALKDEKFNRIILRENLGIIDREKYFDVMKDKLKDEKSFIYIKTMTFSPVKNSKNKNYLLGKQKKIIDFWNYNFSTSQNIINDLKKMNYEVKYKNVNILFLIIFYNPIDIINILKLYFIELNLGLGDIMDWLGIYSLNLSHFKVHHFGDNNYAPS